ncbi:DUF3923 family protein [Staphylococcus felis]|uniref:DUF3923 family protein n=1 Tax=Staphylococcus felis TaxID=46127 RepID=UPI00248075A8|nr:DUF3923 family protein [Staphylococcus felis]
MKLSWILWWILNAFWLVIFIASTIFIWTRSVDAAGITQTHDAKLAAFIVLVVAFLFPFIVQIIWMIINIIVSKNKQPRKYVNH